MAMTSSQNLSNINYLCFKSMSLVLVVTVCSHCLLFPLEVAPSAVEDPYAPGSLLATDCSKAVVLVLFLLNVFGVGVSCRNLYYFVVYLYVNGSGSITSVGEERANLSAVV